MEKTERLVRELERFSKEREMSFSKIAKAMGIGSSTLSEFKNGTYKGDTQLLAEKVEDFLNRHKKKMKRIDFSVETEIKKRIFWTVDIIKKYVASNVIEGLTESAKIGYIYGRAGIGKTHALMEYVKEYKGRGIFITAEAGISITGILRKLARELRLDTDGTTEQLKERIKDSIRFTETIIFIDEGEHLKNQVIDNIRTIGDQTGVGIIIAGTEALKSKVYSQRKGYEYLSSRAVVNMTLKELQINDVSKIVKAFIGNDIDLYSEKEFQQIVSYLNSTVRGSTRQLANLLSLSSDIANQNISTNGKITMEYIKAAVTMLAIN